MIVPDNFRLHHAKLTRETAEKLDADLVPATILTKPSGKVLSENYHHYS